MKYPSKILLAWAEAISGNSKIRDWLMQNEYPELGLFTFALRNDESSRQWLLDNNFPHLMALINASEGNEIALEWLEINNLDMLKFMALAVDNDVTAMAWVMAHTAPEIQLLTQKMQFVKNRIDADNNDSHKFNNT